MRQLRWWVGAIGIVGLLVAGLLIVPQLVAGPSDPPTAAPPAPVTGPPDFDVVLRLRAELAAASADDSDYPVDPAQAALVATSPQGYTPLGRISSPVLGLDTEYAAGVYPSVLDRGPGHWPGSASAGRPGNVVLSGHRTTRTHPFRELDRLTPGDPIVLTDGGSAPVTYRVTETAILAEADYLEYVLRPPADPAERRLTLFACHPKGDRTQRIVVRAVAEAGDGR